jgi:4-amino-4-deoxy-L-arabinose transferase-like glycosyltransferase
LLSISGIVDVFTPGNTPQYYPLVFAGFWIEHALVGVDPLAYHAVNLLMHAANAVLLFVVLTRLNIRNAFWIAAIFAAHPMAVESVAWVTERKNVQSMLFALASFAMYLRFIDAPKGRVLGTWLASFLLFACALLSKTTAIFVPPCIVLALLWLQKPINTRLVLSVLPYFAIGLASGLFTAHVERTIVGATGSEFGFTLLERLQLAGRTAAFYISRFTLPTEQIFIYPRFTIDVRSIVDWLPCLGGVAVLLQVVLVVPIGIAQAVELTLLVTDDLAEFNDLAFTQRGLIGLGASFTQNCVCRNRLQADVLPCRIVVVEVLDERGEIGVWIDLTKHLVKPPACQSSDVR